MANIDQVQLPDGSQYHIIDDTSGYATTTYVQDQISTINKNTIGLGNVDNTADINKPVSSPQQTALNGKVNNGIVAYVESNTTATKRYEVGDQFILNGVLYTATAIIAVNDTIVVNTNCEASDTLVEQNKTLTTAVSGKVSKSGDTMSGNLKIDRANGTSSIFGTSEIIVGNSTPSGTSGNSRGYITIYGTGAYWGVIQAEALTSNRTFTLPDKTGVIATTSDVSARVERTGDTMSGNLTIDLQNGGADNNDAWSGLNLGNAIPKGTAKHSAGYLRIYSESDKRVDVYALPMTVNRSVGFPDKNGTVAMTSDISSEKFKENIKPLSADEANKILDVEVVTFDYKDGVGSEDERYNNRGVIAEQVEPIIPYVIERSTEDEEEVLRVDYRKFIPYLIKMVQNQQTEIDNLKAEIEKIKEEKQ